MRIVPTLVQIEPRVADVAQALPRVHQAAAQKPANGGRRRRGQPFPVGIPLLFFVSNRLNPASGGNGNDIYVAERSPNGIYEGVLSVDELNSPLGDFRPTIRYDGLEIVFGSNRPLQGISGSSLWMSSRTTAYEPWSPPVSLGTIINSGAFENTPYLSPDGRELYFSAFRADRLGGSDLYVSTRSRRTGR